eukprot:363924-Chlamydomonas_euryale.AAC.5
MQASTEAGVRARKSFVVSVISVCWCDFSVAGAQLRKPDHFSVSWCARERWCARAQLRGWCTRAQLRGCCTRAQLRGWCASAHARNSQRIGFTLDDFGKAEVGCSHVAIGAHQHVFWLQIAPADALGVHVLERQHHAGRIKARVLLRHECPACGCIKARVLLRHECPACGGRCEGRGLGGASTCCAQWEVLGAGVRAAPACMPPAPWP